MTRACAGQQKRPDRSVLQRIVHLRAEAEMRDRSRLQVVPAALLGQPLLEVFGTETAVMAKPDASRKAAFCGGEYGGGSIHASPRTPCSARVSTLVVTMGTRGRAPLVVALRVWTQPTAITARMALSWVSPVMACGVLGIADGAAPVYRDLELVGKVSSGRGQADLGEKAAYRTIAGSTLVPGFLPRSWGSRS